MTVDPSTRRHLQDHLGQAEFSLNVAKHFACLAGSPAEAHVRTALAQVALARQWVRETLAVGTAAPPRPPPECEKLPLTRRERLTFRHVASP